MHQRQTGRQTDGQMNWTDFVRPLPQSWRLNHVFRKFENKTWKQYKKREYNQHSSVFKEYKNNDP